MSASVQAQGASVDAIQSHYDVGTEFYRLWLDPQMVYSCALWSAGDTLEVAQKRKLAYHADRARAFGAKRVLDIGCGWGSLMNYLVCDASVSSVVGLTLSADQARHVLAKGDPRISVVQKSWEEYQPAEPFDAIVSIGAFEHFVTTGYASELKVERYRKFFESCRGWLKVGGFLSLQTICYEDASEHDFSQFFAQSIFPESDLPHPWEILRAASRLFETVELRMDRADYVRTLKHWYRTLHSKRDDALRLVGAETVERYERYLQLAMLGFHSGRMNLARVAFRRIDRAEET